jgi:hypothetical protein
MVELFPDELEHLGDTPLPGLDSPALAHLVRNRRAEFHEFLWERQTGSRTPLHTEFFQWLLKRQAAALAAARAPRASAAWAPTAQRPAVHLLTPAAGGADGAGGAGPAMREVGSSQGPHEAARSRSRSRSRGSWPARAGQGSLGDTGAPEVTEAPVAHSSHDSVPFPN